jgi:pimeloyl-ACP methyl ester carboxylesterase
MTDFITTALGDRLAYDLRGSGPALIFVAGAGPYRAVDPITTETAELASALGLTTVVYDRVGRGESQVEGRIGLDRELASIAALLDVVGSDSDSDSGAVLCGHSSGCSISLKAAAAGLPVTGLVLWEAPLGPENGGAREWAAEFERLLDAGDKQAALLWYMKDMPEEFLAGVRNSPVLGLLAEQVSGHLPDAESLAWIESGPLADVLADIHVPVEALIGLQTFPIMEGAADRLVAALPQATQKRFPGAMHSWEAAPMAEELAAFVLATRR